MYHCQIFDVPVASERALPELPEAAAREGAIQVQFGTPDRLARSRYQPCFEWLDAQHRSFCICRKHADDYLLVFPEFGDFHVTARGMVHCMPIETTDWNSFRHLLVNWVLPRYLASQGRLVVHAGAVTLASGRTIALLGPSGAGKSTLVASFLGHGSSLLNDDCIMLRARDGQAQLIGCYPGIRLYPENIAPLFGQAGGFAAYSPRTPKQQWLGDASTVPPGWQRLDALFLLAEPPGDAGRTVTISPMPASQSVAELARAAFTLEPLDRAVMTGNFNTAAQAVGQGTAVFSLAYPRSHAILEEVRQAVSDCLETVPAR